jgi:hypothetical protein
MVSMLGDIHQQTTVNWLLPGADLSPLETTTRSPSKSPQVSPSTNRLGEGMVAEAIDRGLFCFLRFTALQREINARTNDLSLVLNHHRHGAYCGQ